MLSVVIPIHNEEPAVLALYDRLTAVLESLVLPYEIIFVDDASTGRSFELLANLLESDSRLKVIRLRLNFGQTAAPSAGFHQAQGDVVISLDGDLQHDPRDLPALLTKIEEGYDIDSGYRKHRVDSVVRKRPSRLANWLMAKASGMELYDFGTTFKAHRAVTLKDINLYGELHRFIPVLAGLYGARVAEVPIHNVARAAGKSHYGLGRTFNMLLDILTIRFLSKYFTRPMRSFGRVGLLGTVLEGLLLGYLTLYRVTGHDLILNHGPVIVAGALLLLAGPLMFSTGLLNEIFIRTCCESQGRRIYAVRDVLSNAERMPDRSMESRVR
jgi:glycosyltransferase involved in cell wall biosynthesis